MAALPTTEEEKLRIMNEKLATPFPQTDKTPTSAALTAVALADEELANIRREHAAEVAELKKKSANQSVAFDKLNVTCITLQKELAAAREQLEIQDYACKKLRKAMRTILK